MTYTENLQTEACTVLYVKNRHKKCCSGLHSYTTLYGEYFIIRTHNPSHLLSPKLLYSFLIKEGSKITWVLAQV